MQHGAAPVTGHKRGYDVSEIRPLVLVPKDLVNNTGLISAKTATKREFHR